MPYGFELFRRIERLQALAAPALVLALAGCGAADSLSPGSGLPATADQGQPDGSVTLAEAPSVAPASFDGGIPFGTWEQPTGTLGATYNGAMRIIGPAMLLRELANIKSRGGKVAIKLSMGDKHVKDGAGNFSLTKWKNTVDQFKGVNFRSYIDDGTIIGHYLMDEPNDPRNWNGERVSPATLEEMARHSKQIWPDMPTLVRTHPDYLGSNHRYLDGAWAQYLHRRGNVNDYVRTNVAEAQKRGLALVVGLNVLNGGPNGTRMSAQEVEAWGSALLSSSYPCAFLMWRYSRDFLESRGMESAMASLRRKAENRGTKSCRA
jgi:hypothetical protein